MIGYLYGTIKEKSPPKLLFLVNESIGYEIETPISTFERLEENQKPIGLYTHLTPREDAMLLFGFLTLEERALFRALIKVNNVGPKLALSILSHMPVSQFVECISLEDSTRLSKIPGLGKKTTERLIIEMKDRLDVVRDSSGETLEQKAENQVEQEVLNALAALGYKPKDAQKLLSKVQNPCKTVEEWIRAALKEAKV